jgi:hypothetical protein
MKVGAENRNQLIVAVVLGVLAIFLVWRTFFSGGEVIASKVPAPLPTTAPPNSGPPARRLRPGRRPGTPPAQQTVTASLDPRLRLDLLKGSEATEYKGSGRNIFRADSEPVIPKEVKNPVIAEHKNPEPPPPPKDTGPPPPPPIPLKFFGFANQPGQPRQAFLSQGEDIFIAKENDVVNRRYKVVKINPNSVEIEDLLANNKQTIPLTAS